MNTFKEIKEILGNEKIELDSKIRKDLNLDSLEFVEKLLQIEDYFIIEISDDDLVKIITIKDLIDCIDKLK